MLYAVIVLLCLLLAATFFAMPKRRPQKRVLKRLSDEDFLEGLRNLARERRTVVRGKTVNLTPLLAGLRKAERIVSYKVLSDKTLAEGEKWYYENLYYVKRFISGASLRRFSMLPACKDGVRILSIARYVVENSYGVLDFARIRAAMDAVNRETVLSYKEIVALPTAIGIALCEQVYMLAGRIVHYRKMQRLAARGLRENGLKSDVYLYYLLQAPGGKKNLNDMLAKRGIRTEHVSFQHAASVVETGRMARFLFEGLKSLTDILPPERTLTLLAVNDELGKNGEYRNMSYGTKSAFLGEIAALSDKINASELFIARKLLQFAAYNALDPFVALFHYPRLLTRYVRYPKALQKVKARSGKGKERLYIFCTLLLAAGIAAGSYFLFGSLLAALLTVIPAVIAAETLINYALSLTVRARPLPEMDYREIPAEHGAMIVVSEFITSAKQMKEAIRHLKTVKETNRDQNITAALLVDLKAADSPDAETDGEVIDAARELENEEGYCIFIRKRTKVGKKYQGHERKRGAIMALCKHFCEGDTGDFLYMSNANIQKPVHIIALDADNVMNVNGAKEMINIIAHPANAQYDLIAARSRYNLFSIASPYAARFERESAYVNYPNYSSLYYNLFRRDIFCGKGIFRLKTFYEKLKNRFPDGKILSHDIIEGAVLTTASGTVIYEDAPKNFIADRERRKRWARGDIQLLPFVGGRWKNAAGETVRTEIRPIYRFLMCRNVLNLLAPVFLFALGIAGVFTGGVLYLFLGLAFLPLMLDWLGVVREVVATKKRLRYAAKDAACALGNTLLEVGLLPYYALSNLILLFVTLKRMLTKGNLLEWKTYYHSQSAGGKYLQEIAPSLILTPLVLVAAFVWGGNVFAAGGFLLWSVLAAIGMHLTAPKQKKEGIPPKILKEYAAKTYAYFRYMRKPGGLIADNLQIKPYKGMSQTTSPTNIGFQLISEVAAYKIGLSSREESISVIKDVLDAVEKLEKWEGNLYNWYKTDGGEISIPFVSSVDSGNFLASLMVVHAFLAEENEAELAVRADTLLKNAKLGALYDGEKRQFYLGYNRASGKFEGHYDLFASESRLTSFLYAALEGDTAHWKSLVRDYTPALGNTLCSWSGTMFEYLMPELFLPSPKNSLAGVSARNAVKIQARRKVRGVFGLSESGYYAFDDNLFYQYRAFGVGKLALGRDKEKDVVSPYSSFLALPYAEKGAVENLKRLAGLGALGDYGFYEAVDLEGQKRVLYSYMTHHQGMIMAALCNALTDNLLQRYLLRDPRIAGAAVLLTEPQEKRRYVSKIEDLQRKRPKSTVEYCNNCSNLEYYNGAAGLTDGSLSAYFDPLGGGFTVWNGILLNRFTAGYGEGCGRHVYLLENGKLHAPSYATLQDSYEKYVFAYSAVHASYSNVEKGLSLDVTIDGNLGAVIHKITTNSKQGAEIGFYEPLAMSAYDAQNAHPVFNVLFLETTVYEKQRVIVAKRRVRAGEKPIFAALVARGFAEITFETNRYNFIGRGHSEKNPRYFSENIHENPAFGDVLEPCFALKGTLKGSDAEIIEILAGSMEELKEKIERLPEDYYGFATEMGNIYHLPAFTNELLYPLINASAENERLARLDAYGARDAFMRHTGGKKLVAFRMDRDNDLTGLRGFLEAVSALRYFGAMPRLAVILPEGGAKVKEESVVSFMQKHHIREFSLYYEQNMPDYFEDSVFLWLDKSLRLPKRPETPKPPAMRKKLQRGLPAEAFILKSGTGGLTEEGYLLPLAKLPAAPYSNVICGERGGFVVTERGGGVQYYENSHEKRITRFDNDPVKDVAYECIAYRDTDGGYYRVNGGDGVTERVLIAPGINRFISEFGEKTVVLEQFIVHDGAVKISELRMEQGEESPGFFYALTCNLGAQPAPPFVYCERVAPETVKMKNLLTYQEVFVKVLGAHTPIVEWEGQNNTLHLHIRAETLPVYIAVGQYEEINALTADALPHLKEEGIGYFRRLNAVKMESPDRALNAIFNDWLPYQVVSARLNGRCGYYQLGGAIGFRDQLQDSLALLHAHPARVRRQILLHAAQQYKEGDVMHWWHPNAAGLRSRISDDKLFLPYCTAEYVQTTGDKTVLTEEIPYLNSPPLREGEHARYEYVPHTVEKETLHAHCLAAIKNALQYGEHGLLLLGTGDWNDGMDYIGEKGKGESVALSMFAYETMEKYMPYCSESERAELSAACEKLKKAVETFAYDGKQYMRLYGDDGKWYGVCRSEKLTIDLLSQSFAVLSGIASPERARSAMGEAARLVDEDAHIIKLLAPALDEETYIGYISAYPKGVRENGGQYTHAAVWYLIALLRLGETERAYELFEYLNPLSRCRDMRLARLYKAEPYVMPADVYAYQNAGRAGWTWYTGSASWTYRLILEEFYGIKRRGTRLYIEPRLPIRLSGSVLQYRSEYGVLQIQFVHSGTTRILADGVALHEKNYVSLGGNLREILVEYE